MNRLIAAACALCMAVFLMPATSMAQQPDLENMIYLDLKDGRVVIQTRPDLAPNHVARIKELVRDGFYDGIVFHRVIDGFMAQTGDPTGTGTGGSGRDQGPQPLQEALHHHAVEKQQVLLAHVAQGLYEHLAVYNGLPRSHA